MWVSYVNINWGALFRTQRKVFGGGKGRNSLDLSHLILGIFWLSTSQDTNIGIELCFTHPEVSQLFKGNVTFQKPLPASGHTLGFSSICAGKTSTTLKEASEWGLVFEGYKTNCTCLLKLLFVPTGLLQEILQDLEPWFSARKFFFSRQKWNLHLFQSFQLEPENTCRNNNQSWLQLDCPALANTWSNSCFVAILAINQPLMVLCVLF